VNASALFTARFRQYKRRVRVVAFVHRAPAMMALAIVVAAILDVLFAIPASWAALLAAAACTTAIGCAAVLAVRRTRSARQTGRAIDERMGLHDLTVTAIEFVHDDAPAALAVVTDAADRLAPHPAVAFPFERPAWLRTAVVSAVIASFTMAFGTDHVTGRESVAGNRDGEGTAAAGRPSSPHGRTGEQANRDGMRTASTNSPAAAERAAERDQEPDRTTRAPAVHQAGLSRQTAADLSALRSSEDRLRGTAAADTAPAISKSERWRGAESATQTTPAAHVPSSPGSGTAASGAGRGGADTAGRGGADGAAGRAGANGSGGVRGGALDANPTTPSAARAGGATAGQVRVARQKAERALAQERVPPRLRAPVRNYFAAIQADPR
jgi:hypothetical protein